jgi:hypothetical protein
MASQTEGESSGLGRPAIGWIGFMILANAWVVYRTEEQIHDLVTHADPRWRQGAYWALPTLIGLASVTIIGLGVLLARRKLGLCLVLLASLAVLPVGPYFGARDPGLLLRAFGHGLIGIAILCALVYQRWHVLQ